MNIVKGIFYPLYVIYVIVQKWRGISDCRNGRYPKSINPIYCRAWCLQFEKQYMLVEMSEMFDTYDTDIYDTDDLEQK